MKQHLINLTFGGGENHISIHRSEIIDRLNVMKKQECTTYLVDDYLDSSASSPSHIDAWCRFKMVQWSFSIVDFLQFNRETVFVAMTYLDRFLSSGSPRARRVAGNRREYQLASMTALYMAIKLFEPKVIDTIQLAELSRGSYKSSDFSSMECDMLFDLKWHVNGPTATSFLVHFLALLPSIKVNDLIFEEARYQIELSLMQYSLTLQHPSNIAAAALMNSIRGCMSPGSTERATILKKLKYITGIDLQSSHLRKIARCMNNLQGEISLKLGRRISPILIIPLENTMNDTNDPLTKEQQHQQSHAPWEQISPKNACISTTATTHNK